ncbi:MAG: zinc-finger domain-containing protein [Pseudomonadota bacterium]|nr:zinc-finger domain-containing protein [Pseudomonadota bacterium]
MSKHPSAVELTAKDLTPGGETFCPNPKAGMKLWSTHPRVYLQLSAEGEAKCPYCGTVYRLKAGESVAHGH